MVSLCLSVGLGTGMRADQRTLCSAMVRSGLTHTDWALSWPAVLLLLRGPQGRGCLG